MDFCANDYCLLSTLGGYIILAYLEIPIIECEIIGLKWKEEVIILSSKTLDIIL